jgi:hypothetical protein
VANWTIQSISYPNPLADGHTEWEKLERFVGFDSYAEAREALTPKDHQKKTLVETSKAAYESFGLLWVDGDRIRVTPGGRQYIEAVRSRDKEEAAWVGLNLLLRCPLAGPRQNWTNGDSDLPIYWGVLAAMMDVGGEIYWEELGRVLAAVTARADLRQAVESIRALRSGNLRLDQVEPPGDHHHGDLYNRLNMAMHHVGLGRMLTVKMNDDRYVDEGGKRRVDRIREGWQRPLVETALGGGASCGARPVADWVDRVPASIDATSIEERFAILGATVPPRPTGERVAAIRLNGDMTWMVDPARVTVSGTRVVGPPTEMCGMATGHRVALRGSYEKTFIVQSKQLATDGVEVILRPARRITDATRVENVFKEIYDA